MAAGQVLRCALIGAGNIAWRYDGGAWDGTRSVSHAACFARHPRTQLVAVFDPDPQARTDAAAMLPRAGHADVAVLDSLDALFEAAPDLVSICSPSKLHAAHLEACLKVPGVTHVWMEKPATLLTSDFESLIRRLAAMTAPPRVGVNYFRRTLPQTAQLKARLDAARVDRGLHGIEIRYSRRLDTNGVHLIDLLGYLTEAKAAPTLDWLRPDAQGNPDFGLTVAGVPVSVIGYDLPFHLIELDAILESGRLSLSEGGARLDWHAAEPNPDYPGFFRLAAPRPEGDAARWRAAMAEGTWLNLCDLVDHGGPLAAPFSASAFAQGVLAAVEAGS